MNGPLVRHAKTHTWYLMKLISLYQISFINHTIDIAIQSATSSYNNTVHKLWPGSQF